MGTGINYIGYQTEKSMEFEYDASIKKKKKRIKKGNTIIISIIIIKKNVLNCVSTYI